ncbi:hypothetical protein [Campylobacter phage CP81]|uniref:Uncharacterized protein n=1 Tax=Campylobacter phage CP81 TaxID=2927008 RepID=G0LWQ2_9CAUD|nr:hypothetical protein FDJ37_gp077 [Campylobacter phage CP81]CBZ42244.1 hypothetical protein [Campylobacter phage CP81]
MELNLMQKQMNFLNMRIKIFLRVNIFLKVNQNILEDMKILTK